MTSERWWRLPGERQRSRFLWFGRGKSKPDEARLSFSRPIPEDAVVLERFSVPAPRAVTGSVRAERPARAVVVRFQPPDREPDRPRTASRQLDVTEHRSRAAAAPPPPGSPARSATLTARLRAALGVPLDLLLPGEHAVLEWAAPVMPYQEDGIRTLVERRRVLLADDMGLGKTVQAIAAIRVLCHQRVIQRTLLIVPASLIDQWRREFAKWAPELRVIPIRGPSEDRAWLWGADAHVAMVSYETFRVDVAGSIPSGAVRRVWDLVVLDEAQRIKNRDSEVSRQVKTLARRRSWALTGTPLENRIDDLASILEFVDHADDGSRRTYAPSDRLLARHHELQLRRKKIDVLRDLPPKQIITVTIPLLSKQREAYVRAEQEGIVQLQERGETLRIEHILELITRLKQLCNRDPVSGESAKFDDIRDRLQVLTAEGHRALLFSQYTDDRFGVAAAAASFQDLDPLTFTGSLSSADRDAVITEFKRDASHRILILSLRAGGVGLNLQDASYVFHIDRWWNPAVERQAEDRTHRLGQRYPVTVIKYTCQDTIEERIEQILSEKQQLFDDFVDDVSLDIATRLTRDDLFRAVKLDPPSRAAPSKPGRTGLSLPERCAAMLAGRGWHVQRIPAASGGAIQLIATRTDEVGLEQTLSVYCAEENRQVEAAAIASLLHSLPQGPETRTIIAAPSGLTDDARQLASQHRITVWDAAMLGTLGDPPGR